MRMQLCLALTVGLLGCARAAEPVLIVADEFPAMRVLAEGLERGGGEESPTCTIVSQPEMPDSLAGFRAVLVYIHGRLESEAERAFIAYAQGGGRLVLLHHSISSGKRANREWFSFLGVELPTGDVAEGGYRWIEGVPLRIFPTGEHFVTSQGLEWPPAEERLRAALPRGASVLEHSEVYLNHRLSGERTILLGLHYEDRESGRTYVQATAGWLRRAGRGWVFYFMPGHTQEEFASPVYRQLIANALAWQPERSAASPGQP